MTAVYDLAAEEAVLGAVLLGASVATVRASGLQPEDFYSESNEQVWRAMVLLDGRDVAVDAVTVAAELRETWTGPGSARVAVDSASGSVPALHHAPDYARAVRNLAKLRRAASAAHAVASDPLDARARASLRAALEAADQDAAAASARQFTTGGSWLLDGPARAAAAGGEDDDVLWAQGEPLLVCGPQGIGKSAILEQLALARAGVLQPDLLGLRVTVDPRPVVYLAADRPSQIRQSMRRMIKEPDRARLDERLRVWTGPLPFRIVDDPSRLADWLVEQDAGAIIVDSLKDTAIGLADDQVGAAVAQAMQHVVAAGIEFAAAHHQRKSQDGRKPRKLEDVYGSTWITAGAGSVLLLWGEPGDVYVELSHLKQPIAEVGPYTIRHDRDTGLTSLPDAVDLLDLAARGVTVADAAAAIYGTSSPDRNQIERARRRLVKLANSGRVERREPAETGATVTYWLPGCVTPRDPLRDPLTEPVTQGHDLAPQLVTQGSRTVTDHAPDPAGPLKGAVDGVRDPSRDHSSNGNHGAADAGRAEQLLGDHAGIDAVRYFDEQRPREKERTP